MTATNLGLKQANPSGTVSVGGVKEYTTIHEVDTTSISDGVEAVCAAIGECGVTTYNQGGETDAAAVLKSQTAKRWKDYNLRWDVTSTWGPLDDDDQSKQGRDEDGNPTDDPHKFADECNRDVMWRQSEMWSARFYGYGEADAINPFGIDGLYEIGATYAIGNSAGEIRDPPDMEEYPIPLYRFRLHRAKFDDAKADQYTNAINENAWTWHSDLWNRDIVAAPKTAWCQSWTGGVSFINGIATAVISVTIAIDPNGWVVKFPDMGYRRKYNAMYDEPPFKASNGMPLDGFPPIPGTKYVTARDGYGEPVRQPIGLDGHGDPLPAGARTIYLYWQSTRLHKEDFTNILAR